MPLKLPNLLTKSSFRRQGHESRGSQQDADEILLPSPIIEPGDTLVPQDVVLLPPVTREDDQAIDSLTNAIEQVTLQSETPREQSSQDGMIRRKAEEGKRQLRESSDRLFEAWRNGQTVPRVSMEYLKNLTVEFHKPIRGGRFADVFIGLDGRHSLQVAIKKFPLRSTGRAGELAQTAEREIKALSHFRHDNIARLLGYAIDASNNVCLVYEFAAGGSLDFLLREKKGRKALNWRKRLEIALSTLSALKYLESRNCSHRDLKPSNICFTEGLERVLLIECEARLVDITDCAQTWSDPYAAPELKKRTLKKTKGSEMYAFGFILQSLITGILPKPSYTPRQLQFLLQNADQRAGIWPEDVLQTIGNLSVECLRSSDDRPSIDQGLMNLITLQSGHPAELTAEQTTTVQLSLAGTSIGKNVSTPSGQCRCGRLDDKGLVCNLSGKPHFCCIRCFGEHVKKHFGNEDILCREVGCKADAFTPRQLLDHVDGAVLVEHFDARDSNRRSNEARRRWHDRIGTADLDKTGILKAIHVVGRGQEREATMQLDCPLECILVPVCSTASKGSCSKNPFSRYRRFHLYFLCAHDKSKIDAPVELRTEKDGIKTLAPALGLSFLAVRVSLKIPFSTWLADIGLEGVLTEQDLVGLQGENTTTEGNLKEDLVHLEEELFAAFDRGNTTSDEARLRLLNRARRVCRNGFDEIAKVAKENPQWRNHMQLATNRDGVVAWVKNENAEKWSASGTTGCSGQTDGSSESALPLQDVSNSAPKQNQKAAVAANQSKSTASISTKSSRKIVDLPPHYAKLLCDTEKTGDCLSVRRNGFDILVDVTYEESTRRFYQSDDLLLGLLSNPSSQWFQMEIAGAIARSKAALLCDDVYRETSIQNVVSETEALLRQSMRSVFVPEYWEIQSATNNMILKAVRYKRISVDTFHDGLQRIVTDAISGLDLRMASNAVIAAQLGQATQDSLQSEARLLSTDVVTGTNDWSRLRREAFPGMRNKYHDFVNDAGDYANGPAADAVFADDRVLQVKGSERSIWFQFLDGRGKTVDPKLFSKYDKLNECRRDTRRRRRNLSRQKKSASAPEDDLPMAAEESEDGGEHLAFPGIFFPGHAPGSAIGDESSQTEFYFDTSSYSSLSCPMGTTEDDCDSHAWGIVAGVHDHPMPDHSAGTVDSNPQTPEILKQRMIQHQKEEARKFLHGELMRVRATMKSQEIEQAELDSRKELAREEESSILDWLMMLD